ncbi:hypothetical protein MBLNU13_g07401t1 [Cladosporium sp. NU13]
MRFTLSAGSAWAKTVAVVVTVFTSLTLADVEFTVPAAGANITAGQIDVQWEESGIKPLISELTQYTLSLMVGGNDLNDMQPVVTFRSDGNYADGLSAQGTIPEGIAAEIPNGFFFRMTSTRQAGGVVINYSNRFNILGLTGDTALTIKQAALALNGNTAGPPAVGNDAPSRSTSSVASSTSSSTTGSPTIAEVPTTTHFTSTETSDGPSVETSESPDDDNTSSGLSKGATAAIAVAVTLAITAIFAGLAWHLYARRRKRQNEIHEIAPGIVFHHKPTSSLSLDELASPDDLVSPKSFWAHTSELSSENMVYEAGSGARRPELDTTVVVRYELEGSVPTTPSEEKKSSRM